MHTCPHDRLSATEPTRGTQADEEEAAFAALWGLGAMDGLSANLVVKTLAESEERRKPRPSRQIDDNTIGYAELDFKKKKKRVGVPYRDDGIVGNSGASRPKTAAAGKVGGDGNAGFSSRNNVGMEEAVKVRRLDMFTRCLTLTSLRSHQRGLMMQDFNSVPLNLPPRTAYPENVGEKNRSGRILPSPHSRALLSPGNQGYINANYMRGPNGMPHRYIATQVSCHRRACIDGLG